MNENRPDVNTRPYCENVTRQRQELTAGVSGTDIKHSTQCIQKAMEEQARRIPEAVALISAGKEMNYGELDRRANQIAWRLQELGVRPEVLVGICMERSMEMVVSLLGILKAGGAYVPLDPDYPEERLSYMTKDAGVRVQLTQGRLRERIGRYEGKQICVDEEWEELGKKSNHSVESGVSSENLAYVIYTSGSTGKPKGVLVTRAGLHNHLRWMQKEFPLDRGDRILQKTPLSFDVSAWEIFGPLLHGASLVMAEPGGHQDPAYLVSCIQEERITVLQLVPMQLQMILEQPHCGRCVSLKRVYCGGEPMSRELAAAISSRLPNVNLYNMYGPTETTIDATCCHHLGHDKEPTVPIGTPIANTQVFILDESMSPVPVGIKGELYIAGHGLARGYLNNPETTAACFIPNPFSTNAGERMYRTGDHGKWLPEGVIEFCGRSDHQLKIRGNRIELGEVESVLVGHDRIRQAAVVPRENHQGEKWLAGFVVLKDDLDKSFGEPQILNYLSARLPDYMVPIQITVLPGLPLTSNGKLDRAVLTQLSNDHAGAPRLCIEPATPMERILVESCADILAARPISVMSTFLEAGGTSLGAARLVTRIRELCNVNLLLRDLLGSKTLRQIALALDHQPPLPARDSAQVAESSKGETLAPASFSQERVWLIEQMDPSSVAYNFGARLVFDGDLNANALLHSLDAIVERHEIYRTTFTERQGHLYQVVHAPWHVDLRVIDVGGEAGQPDAIAKQDLQKTFDLTRLPLVRWKLLRIRSDKHVLLISEHHMVHDGWSFHLFLKDLTELYRFYTGGGPLRLSKPPMGFSDCARRQREWMNHPEAKEQLEYWKSALADAPPLLSLPYDHRRPSVQTYRGDVIKVELNRDLQDALLHTASRQRVTLFMLCAAAFQVLLFRYSGQEDFCIGTAVASRGLDGSEDVIGMFVNDVALRTPIEGNFTVAQVIAKMKQTAVEAYAHQEIPFQKIVEAVHPVRDPGYNPIFQAAFSFHDSPVECAPLKDLNLDIESGLANGSAKFDINVVIVPHQKQGVPASFTFHPEIAWEYNSDLFEGKIIRQMARHYIRLLEEITHDVGRRVSEVCIVTDEDVRQVVEIWNDTEMAFPNTKFIHEVFEDQVRKTPNSIAVVFEDVSLTYAELNARANQLAHYLRGLGVRPDVRVAVCMERGVEMIVGLLAILKAGGAYVPLDSSYPSERLQHMLADSAPIALLTQGHLQALFTDVRQTMPLLDLATAAPPWKTEPDMNLERADVGLTPENLVYVIYTSGSTGTPKGVLVAHQNLVSSTFARKVTYGKLGRFLLLSPLWFDSSVAGIFGTLTNGDTLIIVPQDVVRDSSLLGESIQHLRVDSLLCVPSLYQQLLEDCPADTHEKWLSKAIVAGEACSPWLVARSASKAPQTALFNEYGPTECTVWATVFRCKAQSVAQSVPIGHPITNSRVYILDGLHQPVPVGVAGELYIGGAGVARGYLNRPELTAERFQPNPFVQGAGTRMYRTGDLGRWLPDGTIEFLGRNDFQVKIRGYRIELEEIEARLAEHTGVREAVVIAREDSAGEKRLVAYYTCRCGNEPGEDEVGAEELRNHLSASLPEYMVPAAYVRLESLPLTANGKLDRNRLPLPTGDAYGVHGYEEPEGEMETVLAAIWAEVLTVERVGRHDNFFELGGHSLLAVRVIARLRQTFNVELTIADLFARPVLASLAEQVVKLQLEQFDPEDLAQALKLLKRF